jgi:hypothetical protein
MSLQPQVPDIETQRAAMNKLSFLVGRWSGEAHILRGPGEPLRLMQTEEAQYKLGGLILLIEGIGREPNGRAVMQALGVVAYDDEAREYRMRAYNDGRYLETTLKLADNGLGITWGFRSGEIRTSSVLQINEKGEWTELAHIVIGSEPPRKFLELRVSRQA